MLYPVLSKATPFNPYGIPDYVPVDYAANSFKLVNEKWEDVTGYINGRFEYVYVNGEVYGVQVTPYELGEPVEYEGVRYTVGQEGAPYVLGLDGKPIVALDGLIYRQPYYCSAGPPEDLIYVTTVEACKAAAEFDYGMWPDIGVFNIKTGKLQIPAEYTQLVLLKDIALGVKGGVMYQLDRSGKVLATLGEGWWIDEYRDGDELLKVNDTTYIDSSGEVVLTLEGIRGSSNFCGEYAYGWRGNPGESYDDAVIFDRQGRVAYEKPFATIYRSEAYYLIDGREVLDRSLRTVYTVRGGDSAGISEVVGDTFLLTDWDRERETQIMTLIGGGKEIARIEGSLWHDSGFFYSWDGNRLHKIYDGDCKLIFENARAYRVSGDGRFIYVDNGKHMGYIDAEGNWVYRINAAYFNLED